MKAKLACAQAIISKILSPSWIIFLGLLLAFALRVFCLQARGVWYDEAFAILYASRSFEEMIAGTLTQVGGAAADVHPLFYYFSLHAWLQLAGDSIFAARFYSVFFGLATIPLVYRLARELFDARVAVVAVLVLALAPFHLAYSQEARMYAQLGFWSALASLAFVRSTKSENHFTSSGDGSHAVATPAPHCGRRSAAELGVGAQPALFPRKKWWIVFVVAGAGMLYSHNLAFIALGALGTWVALDAWRTRTTRILIATVLAGLAMIALWLPWLVNVPGQFGKIEQAYWVPAPTLATLVQTLLVFTFDFDNAAAPRALFPILLFGAMILPALIAITLRRAPDRRHAIFAAAMATLPIALLYLLSQARPVYIIRALMPAFLWYAVLAAWMLANAPRTIRYFVGSVLIVLVAAILPAYYSYAEFPRSPFEQAAKYLRAQVQSGDAIVHDNKLSYFPIHLYDRTLAQSFLADPTGAGSDTLALPTQQALQIYATGFEDATQGKSRVWFIIFQNALDDAARENRPHPNKAWMDSHFKEISLTRFNDLNVYLYQR